MLLLVKRLDFSKIGYYLEYREGTRNKRYLCPYTRGALGGEEESGDEEYRADEHGEDSREGLIGVIGLLAEGCVLLVLRVHNIALSRGEHVHEVQRVDRNANHSSIGGGKMCRSRKDYGGERRADEGDNDREEKLREQKERVGRGLYLVKIGARSVTAVYRRKVDIGERKDKKHYHNVEADRHALTERVHAHRRVYLIEKVYRHRHDHDKHRGELKEGIGAQAADPFLAKRGEECGTLGIRLLLDGVLLCKLEGSCRHTAEERLGANEAKHDSANVECGKDQKVL